MQTEFEFETEAALGDFAARLAPLLGPGDTLLLSGPVGAGKSVLARAIIAARLRPFGPPGDIPSPSFTLVQTYAAGPLSIWHSDLYRLSGPEEVVELGFDAALGDALVLIEWPDRLGRLCPPRRLELALTIPAADPGRRGLVLRAVGPDWGKLAPALSPPEPRAKARARFLAEAGVTAAPDRLAGDASTRVYYRLPDAVLMDAPADAGGIDRFVAITEALRAKGFSAPELFAADRRAGFLLMEDLGDALFARWLSRKRQDEPMLYRAAASVLAALQARGLGDLPPYSDAIYREEAGRFLLWYLPAATGAPPHPDTRRAFEAIVAGLTAKLGCTVPVLVDYHAENLIWRPEREGVARVGLLDYQDARLGHPAYDLASLLQDARRDVGAAARRAARDAFLNETGHDAAGLDAAMAALGAQRNLKILGLFARLARRDGKPQYLALLPRVWAHLQDNLAHPALGDLSAWIRRHAPPPDASIRARLAAA